MRYCANDKTINGGKSPNKILKSQKKTKLPEEPTSNKQRRSERFIKKRTHKGTKVNYTATRGSVNEEDVKRVVWI